jgi:hypothetical protein
MLGKQNERPAHFPAAERGGLCGLSILTTEELAKRLVWLFPLMTSIQYINWTDGWVRGRLVQVLSRFLRQMVES